ncbi:hypothetical protein [Bosea sp. LjRoot237]|uniref:hypothetical protein n=1 Tax=Bosea sp. LjRoot237 TaxID=3342292 RepID=UPI003ED0F6E8
MRKLLLSAAFCAVMASCSASPVMAQCVGVEGFLEQIEAAKPAGLTVKTFGRAETARIVEILSAESPPPEGFKPDAVIMVSGDRAAMLLFVEGERICQRVTLSLKGAELLLHAAFGRPV